MNCSRVLQVLAICALSTFAIPLHQLAAQQLDVVAARNQRYAQMGGNMPMMSQGMGGMMGGRRMGGQVSPDGSVRGATDGKATGQGGRTETVCGFAGGNPTHGAAIYARTCAACHGADGRGRISGAPDFTRNGGVLRKPHAALQAHILNGYSSPNSPVSMPPRGGNPGLTDQDIRDVHAYLHKAFGCG